MVKVIGISFLNANRIYYFAPGDTGVKNGDYVIVETERGLQFGQAVTDVLDMPKEKVFLPLKDIIRIANENDMKTNKRNDIDAVKALEYAKKLVIQENLDMKLFEDPILLIEKN